MTKFITISIEITVEDNVDDTKYFAFLVRGPSPSDYYVLLRTQLVPRSELNRIELALAHQVSRLKT